VDLFLGVNYMSLMKENRGLYNSKGPKHQDAACHNDHSSLNLTNTENLGGKRKEEE
jgi:hypothetical protein